MKRVYWRPQKVSRKGLWIIAIASLVGLALVMRSPIQRRDPRRELKWDAARHAAKMMDEVKRERQRRGLPVEAAFDPAESGLVGAPMSAVTSRPSHLRVKQTSINANFAAAIVDMLDRAGVGPGDTVAVGWSGSFPAFNICLCSALDRLEVRPLIIASATSSQYGANQPEWMWLDMERHLRDQGLTHCRSVAASLGAGADRGLGLSVDAIRHIEQVVQRNDVPLLSSTERSEAVRQRIESYETLAGEQPIAAYINVGGGVASTGGEQGKALFQPGLNGRVGHRAAGVNCVMAHFAAQGTPVIHLNQATQLAEAFGFPVAPTETPALGIGAPFETRQPNRILALVVLVGLMGGMRFCVSSGQGYRAINQLMEQLRPQQRSAGLAGAESPVREPQLMA